MVRLIYLQMKPCQLHGEQLTRIGLANYLANVEGQLRPTPGLSDLLPVQDQN